MSPAKLLLPIFVVSVALVLVAIAQDRSPNQGNAPKVLDHAAAPSSKGNAAAEPTIAEAYAKLPLSFEVNQGQTGRLDTNNYGA
jgi:hypothetical protein